MWNDRKLTTSDGRICMAESCSPGHGLFLLSGFRAENPILFKPERRQSYAFMNPNPRGEDKVPLK